MKKYILPFVLISMLLFSSQMAPLTMALHAPFTDIQNSFARDEITLLHKQGIVIGDEKGRFNPAKPVTRAEFVTMLGRTLGIKQVNSPLQVFRDVSNENWANGWIQAAAQLGIVGGTSPATFAPGKFISRQEAAAILVRSRTAQPSEQRKGTLADQKEIASWALPYVNQAIASGMMTGFEGRFRPLGNLSRQELAVVLSRMLGTSTSSNGERSSSIHLAWQYGGSTADFIKQVQKSPINVLSPRWFFLDKTGKLTDNGDVALIKWAQQNGKQVWAMVGNRFQADVTHSLISQASQRKAFIERILHLSEKYQLDGINIDFENVKSSDRANLTQFVRELSTALKQKGILLSIDVPPNAENSWTEAYDYAVLGQIVDYLVVMTYDEHWSGHPKAGSVSSLSWYEQHLKKITTVVPAKKVIAGIPLYTRDWFVLNNKVQSKDLLIQEQYNLLASTKPQITWDAKSAQYIATYIKSNVTHTVWVEDSRSIALKIRASRKLGITGNAYWHIGAGTTDVWTTVDNFNYIAAQ